MVKLTLSQPCKNRASRVCLTPLRHAWAITGAGTEQPGPVRDKGKQDVAQIWLEVLDIPAADRAMPFGALGGDSLLAVRMLARLANRTGVRVWAGWADAGSA